MNTTTTTTAFIVPAAVAAVLPHYGELDYNLPTLKGIFNACEFSPDGDTVDAAVAALDAESQTLFDDTLMTLCGWIHSTLCEMAQSRNRHWLDIFFDEMDSDDEDPFKETGRQILTFSEANDANRAAVDAVYVALFNLTLTTALTRIVDAISDQLDAEKD